ncbi:MAG TPA: orotidine-5'-phosphate decarboxylase [Nitrospiria bacterium]|nr:orotidine-5'-phosphate decarboxylase [Nitrospiria bacterium]
MTDRRAAARGKLIVALDVPSAADARRLVAALKGHVGLFKVGLELFVSAGPSLVDAIADLSDADIFLDLKLHDIPATMRAAIAAASKPRVRFLTVHCEQPDRLVGAGTGQAAPQLLGVTALTSIGQAEMTAAGWFAPGLTVEELVLRRAAIARDAGCAGVVCSGNEVRAIKRTLGRELMVVTPGIRPAWAAVPGDDQRRAVTPAEAIAAGADFIVVGRPIRAAKDPGEAAERVVDEIEETLGQAG